MKKKAETKGRDGRAKVDFRSWPKCPTCHGPAAPEGPPLLAVTFDVETRSEMNLRNRFAKAKRAQETRQATIDAVAVALGEGQALPEVGPYFVRFTRFSPVLIDDDGLGPAMKWVRDAVAAMLKIDDGSPAFGKGYAQEVRKTFGVRVEVWNLRVAERLP